MNHYYDLESAAHVVQLALTPVFLLSGIAALMNVFATRLTRVADQVETLTDRATAAMLDRQLGLLKWRTRLLDAAVLLSGAYDLGAGGHGVTTDCHDATDQAAFDPTTGGVTGDGPHCCAGGRLKGASVGIDYRF